MHRKIILYIAASLDGYIAGPNHELDWLPTGQDYGYKEFIAGIDILLVGRKTYDLMIEHGWWDYPGMKAYIFSRQPGQMAKDANVTFIAGDPANVVAEIRKTDGKDIWLVGGGELAKSFLDTGLVDEAVIAIVPVVLGDGIPLFPKGTRRTKFRLTELRKFDSGLIMLNYIVER